MNNKKIDDAVLVMQGLNEAERAVVIYTVEREAGRKGRPRNSKNRKKGDVGATAGEAHPDVQENAQQPLIPAWPTT